MPNRAMITVTTADSKYSRQTDFGGPLGFASGCGERPCPFRLKSREREKDFGSVFVSETLIEAGLLDGLFVISKIILDTLTAAVKFRQVWREATRRPRARRNCKRSPGEQPMRGASGDIRLLSLPLA